MNEVVVSKVDVTKFNSIFDGKKGLTHDALKKEWTMISQWLGITDEDLLQYTNIGQDVYTITAAPDANTIGAVVQVASSLSMAIMVILDSAKYNHNNCDVEWVDTHNGDLVFCLDGIWATINSYNMDVSFIDF